jgi:hypothetical protein
VKRNRDAYLAGENSTTIILLINNRGRLTVSVSPDGFYSSG